MTTNAAVLTIRPSVLLFNTEVLTSSGKDDTVLSRFTVLWPAPETERASEPEQTPTEHRAHATQPGSTTAAPDPGTSAIQDAPDFLSRWLAMQEAAEQGDAYAFIELSRQIDWSRRSSKEWREAVHMALSAGAHLLARKLATEGAQARLGDPELAKMARILAPPRFLGTRPADPSVGANIRWMREHAARYRGRWVAVRDGELAATASSLAELLAKVPDREKTLFARA